ncbi:hypothetical protein PLICRDRAFT_36425 [Plicaturopsis crispa FD-325 SS-3]|nr:hypothetical protein PLICRDRAFT_36425 [Plicaturopsis crispa FD-325 SS-3]
MDDIEDYYAEQQKILDIPEEDITEYLNRRSRASNRTIRLNCSEDPVSHADFGIPQHDHSAPHSVLLVPAASEPSDSAKRKLKTHTDNAWPNPKRQKYIDDEDAELASPQSKGGRSSSRQPHTIHAPGGSALANGAVNASPMNLHAQTFLLDPLRNQSAQLPVPMDEEISEFEDPSREKRTIQGDLSSVKAPSSPIGPSTSVAQTKIAAPDTRANARSETLDPQVTSLQAAPSISIISSHASTDRRRRDEVIKTTPVNALPGRNTSNVTTPGSPARGASRKNVQLAAKPVAGPSSKVAKKLKPKSTPVAAPPVEPAKKQKQKGKTKRDRRSYSS